MAKYTFRYLWRTTLDRVVVDRLVGRARVEAEEQRVAGAPLPLSPKRVSPKYGGRTAPEKMLRRSVCDNDLALTVPHEVAKLGTSSCACPMPAPQLMPPRPRPESIRGQREAA